MTNYPKPIRDLVTRVKSVHSEAEHHLAEAVKHIRLSLLKAKEAGELLRQLQPLTKKDGHKWKDFVAEAFPAISQRSLSDYTSVAEKWDIIRPYHEANPRLTIQEALRQVKRWNRTKKKHALTDPEYVARVRKRLVAAFSYAVKNWHDDTVLYFGQIMDGSGDIYHRWAKIEEECERLNWLYVEAESKYQQLKKDGVPAAQALREYHDAIRNNCHRRSASAHEKWALDATLGEGME